MHIHLHTDEAGRGAGIAFKMAERGGRGSGGHGSLDKSITLPPDEIFRNLENAKRFAIDIGNHGDGGAEEGGKGDGSCPAAGTHRGPSPAGTRGTLGHAVP